MKRIGLILFLLFECFLYTSAQQINRREYFFDTDPGPGNGTIQSFSARDSIIDTFTIPTTGLAIGFHRVYVRYRNTTGAWGQTEERLFYIYDTTRASQPKESPKLAKGEYFIDTDPGTGNGTAVASFTPADSVTQTFNIDTKGLKVGFHRLYMRYSDTKGAWGNTEERLFYIYDTVKPVVTVSPQLLNGEYFIDNDPGVGAGTAVAFTGPVDSLDLKFNVNISGLNTGLHYVYFRFRDVNGQWGHAEPRKFRICSSPLDNPAITGNSTSCPGGSLSLSAATVTGASGYYWTGPNGFTSKSQNITITGMTNAKAGEYRVVAIRAGGTACDTSGEAFVKVNLIAPPSSKSITVLGSVNLCSGDSAVLSVPSQAGFKYRWKINGNNTTNAGDTLSSLVVKTGGTYNVFVTNNAGCSTLMRDTIIKVGSKPILSTISGKTSVSAGATETYSVTNTNGSVYNWMISNGTILSGTGTNSISVQWQNMAGTGSVKVVEINTTGCTSDTQSLIITVTSLSKTLTVSPTNLSFAASGETKQVTVSSNTTWTASTDEPAWVTIGTTSGSGNATIDISVSANPNQAARTAIVTLTDGGTLTAIINITQGGINLSVGPDSLNFTASGGSKQVSVSSNTNWTATTDEPTWVSINPTSGSGNATPQITVSANPDQSVRTATVTFSAGSLTQVVSISQDFTSGISYQSAQGNIMLFPNPTTGLFTIKNMMKENAQVSVYDATGRAINEFKVLANGTLSKDYSHLPPGVYMIHIISSNCITTYNLIITD